LTSYKMRITLIAALCLSIMSVASWNVFAAESSESNPDHSSPAFEGVSSFELFLSLVKVILALIVIIGLFYVLVKFLAQKNKNWMKNRTLRLLGGVHIGQHKSVQIVEVGESIYILGVGEDINLIDKIDRPEEVAKILNSYEAGFNSASNKIIPLGQWLQKLKNQRYSAHEPIENNAPGEPNHSFKDLFQSKMNHLSQRHKLLEDIMIRENKKDWSNKNEK
jgi:flagellar protein FliO/FliZ